MVELPPGWGSELGDDAQPEVGPIRFVAARRVEVTLPDGSTRMLDVP